MITKIISQLARALLLSIGLMMCGTVLSQKIFTVEGKYTRTKYMGSRSSRENQPSFSYQISAGAAKEIKEGLRLGVKLGITIDKVYSSLNQRANWDYSRNNLLSYLGISIQKRLLADPQKWVSLWACVDIAAEPFLSCNSSFTHTLPTDSLPENDILFYNAAYIDKRMRVGISPMLRMELRLPKQFLVFAQIGYAIEFGKSNLTNKYRTSPATQTYFSGSLPEGSRTKENYLFAGGGIGYTL